MLCVQVGGRRRGGGRERAGVAFAWDWHDRQAPLRSFRVGPCTAAPFAWRSCCLVFTVLTLRYYIYAFV